MTSVLSGYWKRHLNVMPAIASYLTNESPLNYENHFLLHFKSSFSSPDFQIFILSSFPSLFPCRPLQQQIIKDKFQAEI